MALIETDCIAECDCGEVNEVNEVNEIKINDIEVNEIEVNEINEVNIIDSDDEVFPEAVAVRYYPAMARVVVFLACGTDVSFSPSDVLGLENAGPDELSHAQISPSGLGVCFPELHVDLYIPGLVEGVVGSESWLAPQMRCSRRPA
jgi:hypothetical protein